MGRSQVTKGKAWERRLVRWFKELGLEAERNLDETREGTDGDVHVQWQSNRFPDRTITIMVEAKHRKTINPWAALRQVATAADARYFEGAEKVLGVCLLKEDYCEPEAWMHPCDFIDLFAHSKQLDAEIEYRRNVQSPGEWGVVMDTGQFAKLLVGVWRSP